LKRRTKTGRSDAVASFGCRPLARNGAGAWGDSAELARAASGGAERHQPEADAGIQQ